MYFVLTILSSFIGFAIFWFLLISFIGKIGGWGKIAYHFPYTGMAGAIGQRKRFQTVKVGISNYNVDFEALPQGLHMYMMFLFKPGHSDILIPWQELQITDNMGLFQNMYKFSFASLPDKSFYAYQKLGEWIIEQKRQYMP